MWKKCGVGGVLSLHKCRVHLVFIVLRLVAIINFDVFAAFSLILGLFVSQLIILTNSSTQTDHRFLPCIKSCQFCSMFYSYWKLFGKLVISRVERTVSDLWRNAHFSFKYISNCRQFSLFINEKDVQKSSYGWFVGLSVGRKFLEHTPSSFSPLECNGNWYM